MVQCNKKVKPIDNFEIFPAEPKQKMISAGTSVKRQIIHSDDLRTHILIESVITLKFRLLVRDKQIEHDVWLGRHQFYYARIETPYRENHPDYNVYTFKIRTPDGEVLTSKDFQRSYTNFTDCSDFVIKWIKEEINNGKKLKESSHPIPE